MILICPTGCGCGCQPPLDFVADACCPGSKVPKTLYLNAPGVSKILTWSSITNTWSNQSEFTGTVDYYAPPGEPCPEHICECIGIPVGMKTFTKETRNYIVQITLKCESGAWTLSASWGISYGPTACPAWDWAYAQYNDRPGFVDCDPSRIGASESIVLTGVCADCEISLTGTMPATYDLNPDPDAYFPCFTGPPPSPISTTNPLGGTVTISS